MFATVVALLLLLPLLYSVDTRDIHRKCGLEWFGLCSGWHAHNVHKQKHRSRLSEKDDFLKYGCC